MRGSRGASSRRATCDTRSRAVAAASAGSRATTGASASSRAAARARARNGEVRNVFLGPDGQVRDALRARRGRDRRRNDARRRRPELCPRARAGREDAAKQIEEEFKKSVEGLQKLYEGYTKDKEEKMAKLKDGGLGLMKSVKASRKGASKDEL